MATSDENEVSLPEAISRLGDFLQSVAKQADNPPPYNARVREPRVISWPMSGPEVVRAAEQASGWLPLEEARQYMRWVYEAIGERLRILYEE